MGVARDASQDEIKRVYRRLARKYHPDVSKEANAEEKFKEVQEAYEVLKDPEKRAAYDQLGIELALRARNSARRPTGARTSSSPVSFGGGDDGGFSDFFSSLFGAAQSVRTAARRRRGARFRRGGRGSRRAIQIDLEDAFRGGAQTIELKAPQLDDDGRVAVKPRTLKVTIPAGVVEGQRIRLAGQGSAGIGGGPAGDLYLEIGFRPHRLFQVEGRDMTLTLPIAPWEAALGATVQTPTLGRSGGACAFPPNAKAGSEAATQGTRPAGPDAGRSVRRAEDRTAAGRLAAGARSSTSRCSTSCRSIRARSSERVASDGDSAKESTLHVTLSPRSVHYFTADA